MTIGSFQKKDKMSNIYMQSHWIIINTS